MDAPNTSATFVIDAAYTDWLLGSPLAPARFGSFVRVTGPGISAVVELDDDGEVAEIDGAYPADLRRAVGEVATLALGEAVVWGGGGRPDTRWVIDATGAIAEAA